MGHLVKLGLAQPVSYAGGPPQLSGFVNTYNPEVRGSNPKHAIYAFILYYICRCIVKRTKINKKRPGQDNIIKNLFAMQLRFSLTIDNEIQSISTITFCYYLRLTQDKFNKLISFITNDAKNTWYWGPGGGQVVSVLAFYSVDPSLNPTEV